MAVFKFTTSGAGIVSVKLPSFARQIIGMLAKPDNAASPVALDAVVYSCPTLPSGSIPAGSTQLATFVSSAGGPSIPFSLTPDGLPVESYLAVQFFDTGTQHSVFIYVK